MKPNAKCKVKYLPKKPPRKGAVTLWYSVENRIFDSGRQNQENISLTLKNVLKNIKQKHTLTFTTELHMNTNISFNVKSLK